MKEKIGIVCLAIAIVFVLDKQSLACSCDSTPNPPCRAFGETSYIFTATVLDSDPIDLQSDRMDQTARLKVLSNIKGVDFEEVTIYTSPRCGPFFSKGATYLVYASGTKEKLVTGMCSRTQLLEKSQEDIEYFRTRSSRKNGDIFGSINKFALDYGVGFSNLVRPLRNVAVRISSGERKERIVVRSDVQGKFKLPNLKPGPYMSELLLPKRLYISPNTPIQEIDMFELKDKGCIELNYYVEFEGEISGTVLDADGKGVGGFDVTLVSADYKFEGPNDTGPLLEWTVSQTDGTYKLDGIPPGKYRLGIGIGGSFDSFGKNGQVFYPNTTNPQEAKVLTVVEGRPLRNINLPVPKKKS